VLGACRCGQDQPKANHVSAMTHRAGLKAGLSPGQATVAALNTASRADLFAGATLAVTMMGLLMLGVGRSEWHRHRRQAPPRPTSACTHPPER
jgi:hypothetical protein